MEDWIREVPEITTHPVLAKVAVARKNAVIFPPPEEIFYAMQLTPFDQVRVVLLGQDPYHQVGQAHGLSFSVPEGIKPPPSLRNIKKELERDLGLTGTSLSDLSHWAKQGVLLLNTVLTVEKGTAGSHRHWGWEEVTDAIIRALNKRHGKLVFLFWGNDAQKKISLIDDKRHHVLNTSHPSSFSARRGFLGCGHFTKVNSYLVGLGQKPINWEKS